MINQSFTPAVALVTGGGRRLGEAIVKRLAGDGASVVIHANGSILHARDLADAIVAGGGRAAAIACDLADAEQTLALMERAGGLFGPVTQLVNSAAIFEADNAQNFDVATFDRQYAINLRAPLLLAQGFFKQLPTGAQGSIVNIIDQRIIRPNPLYFSYSIAKSGLWMATRTMAQAFAPDVRVNAVAPGPVLPNQVEGAERFAAEVAAIPLQRAVAPEEIADAVAWLMAAQSVTGQLIALDCGQHLAWRTPDVALEG